MTSTPGYGTIFFRVFSIRMKESEYLALEPLSHQLCQMLRNGLFFQVESVMAIHPKNLTIVLGTQFV